MLMTQAIFAAAISALFLGIPGTFIYKKMKNDPNIQSATFNDLFVKVYGMMFVVCFIYFKFFHTV